MPRQVDEEVAGDIEKESVFVSPAIDRIVVNPDGKTASVVLKDRRSMDESMDKAARFLDVMAKQVSGYEIKAFAEHKRKDDGPYQRNVNEGLVERGWRSVDTAIQRPKKTAQDIGALHDLKKTAQEQIYSSGT